MRNVKSLVALIFIISAIVFAVGTLALQAKEAAADKRLEQLVKEQAEKLTREALEAARKPKQ